MAPALRPESVSNQERPLSSRWGGPTDVLAIHPQQMELSGPRRSLVWEARVERASLGAERPANDDTRPDTPFEVDPPSDRVQTAQTAMASTAWIDGDARARPPSAPPSSASRVDRDALRAELRELRRLELARRAIGGTSS